MLESSDAVALGSPDYFDTVGAQVKLMIDCCNCLMLYVKHADGTWQFKRRLKKRKNGVFLAVAGEDQEFKTIQITAKGFFEWVNVELVETILYSDNSNELGSVKNDRQKMAEAFDAGVRLTERREP